MLAKHTVHEEPPFGLKDIGVALFGEEAADEQQDLKDEVLERGGKWNKGNKDMYMASMQTLAKYAIKDVILTLKVYRELQEELENQGLVDFFYDKEVMPLYRRATIPMKLNGVFVDVDYFEKMKTDVEDGILRLTSEVFETLGDDIKEKVQEILDKSVRTSQTGEFAEGLLRYYDLPVPLNKKTGKPTLAKSALRQLEAQFPKMPVLDWLLWEAPKIEVKQEKLTPEGGTETVIKKVADPEAENPHKLKESVVYEVKREIYVRRNPDKPFVFNLGSTHHLSWLLFDKYLETPKSYSRQTGKPQVNKDSLKEYSHLEFITKLMELKKEEKLLSTYIKPIIEKQKDGWIYPSFQQWGTTSGRYSCGGGLNLQTLPRDDSRIKQGFIAPPGYKVVNADFSALEPRIFSWVCQDANLKAVWQKGYDLYSQVAIDVFGLTGVSADPNASNYLKKVAPEERQKAKVFTLAVPYGANAGRIASIMGIEYKEAQDIIDRYLDAYPGLKDYMRQQEQDAKFNGMVYTMFGRIRHLDDAKEMFDYYGQALYNKKNIVALLGEEDGLKTYFDFRTLMNNSKNFPIQATAAHVTNASLIYLADLFDEHEIEGWICLQVHDEITCLIKEPQAELASELLKESMENNWIANEIDVPMISEPLIGDNFSETK